MRSSHLKVVHVSPRVQAQGGIEALLEWHRAAWPGPQAFVALFDRAPESRENYTNLNFTWRTSLGRMRREFARAMAPHAGSIVIYHNAWGLPFFASGDGAARRLAFCHATPDYFEEDFPACADWLDGIAGVTPALSAAWARQLPALSPEHTSVLPIPVAAPAGLAVKENSTGEIVLGYAGRVVREHKRLDRLPEFLRALEARGVRCRFEVLGDGPLRAELKQQLGDRVTFHGWTSKADYWRILAGWDGMVFFSELEGGPHALLESMALGGLPFFPQLGGSLGDHYAPRVDARCHYPAGDMAALAENVRAIFAADLTARAALRERARAAVAMHTWEGYTGTLIDWVERVAAAPRISRAANPPRARASDVLPLGVVTRWARGRLRQP